MKVTPAEPETRYRFVGLDDFARRKGHTYGTVRVDLQRGRAIDPFDGRDGVPVAARLERHPGIEVITRARVARLFEQHASALDAALEPPPTAAPGSSAARGRSRAGGLESRAAASASSSEFVRRAERRSDEGAERVTTVTAIPESCGSLTLARELSEVTRGSSETPLSDWLGRGDGSVSRLVGSFAEASGTASAAVQGASSPPWSNGPVEGHVNRLECVTRMMYGRAGRALLRARVRAESRTCGTRRIAKRHADTASPTRRKNLNSMV